MKKYDVVAVGDANIDLMFRVPSLPKYDSKVVGKKINECVGGTVANSACVLGQLGTKTLSLSSVGDDHYGQMILNDFKRFRVDTRFVDVIPRLSPNLAIIFLDHCGEKALVFSPSEETQTNRDNYTQAIKESKVLYTMPGNIEKFKFMSGICKMHNTKIAVDIEPHIADTKEKLETILTASDIVIFNLEGFLTCTGLELTVYALRQLVEQYQLDVIVVTCGAEGAIAVTKDSHEKHDGFCVDVVDTTGAGDTFNASFLHALLEEKTLKETLAFACASAAISIGYLGARNSILTKNKVEEFINDYK
ncbi:carbohydrate kinase family protein [Providencia hangzhouensis]|uniref:carbohydrate kinase family protein n=1 Tax=Providencia hangzhouensis TaxID=3031799 RepID=UPI0034DD6AFA